MLSENDWEIKLSKPSLIIFIHNALFNCNWILIKKQAHKSAFKKVYKTEAIYYTSKSMAYR